MKSAANIIVGNEDPKVFELCLKSLFGKVDYIVVGFNGDSQEIAKLLEKYQCEILKTKWIDDFGKSRNEVLEHTKKVFPDVEVMIWLDSDDEVLHPENIPDLINKGFENLATGAIWCPWHYHYNDEGICDNEILRERILRIASYRWTDTKLHETLVPKQDYANMYTDVIEIKHHASLEKLRKTGERNLKIIIEQYEDEEKNGKLAPKTIFDLARTLLSMGDFGHALEYYKIYVTKSGWLEEVCQAYNSMGEICRKFKRYDEAIEYFSKICGYKPDWKMGYYGLAYTYFNMDDFNKTLTYLMIGKNLNMPSGIPIDPTVYTIKPYKYEAMAFMNITRNMIDSERTKECLLNAIKAAGEVLKYSKDKIMEGLVLSCKRILDNINISETLIKVKGMIEEEKDEEKLKYFIKSIPKIAEDQPVFIRLRNKYTKFSGNKLCIFCMETEEKWSPNSVIAGVGGSEEAVINMSKELCKLGWLVDVFCSCDAPGNYSGVMWHDVYEYDAQVPYDIFVSWRTTLAVEFAPIKAKKYVWFHDVVKPEAFNPERTAKTEKFIFLSKFHRNLIPKLPDNKILLSSNGILLDQFGGMIKQKKKCIYASSPDRGLEILLDIWPDILAKHPDAYLHIYYGFTQNAMKLKEKDIPWNEWRKSLLKKVDNLKTKNVIWHGKVGHIELAEAYSTSEYWLYPCHSFDEISCISAMKAQAAGCYPITTTKAALMETVKYGIKVTPLEDNNLDDFKRRYLSVVLRKMDEGIKEKDLIEMKKAAKGFTWTKVGEQWDAEFRRGNDIQNNLE